MRFLKISLLFFFAYNYSQTKTNELIYSKAECQEPIGVTWMASSRIISSTVTKDTLSLEIQYIENCANGSVINYKINKDTITFNNDLNNSELADCDCVFKTKLKIKNPVIKNPVIKINNTKGIKEIKVSNNYYQPTKYVEKDNKKIMVNDDNGFIYQREYFESGKIKILHIRKRNYSEKIMYYENGLIKSINQFFLEFDYNIVKEWDNEGNLIKYENTFEIESIAPTYEEKDRNTLLILTKSKNVK